jgi:hypothetical protein
MALVDSAVATRTRSSGSMLGAWKNNIDKLLAVLGRNAQVV